MQNQKAIEYLQKQKEEIEKRNGEFFDAVCRTESEITKLEKELNSLKSNLSYHKADYDSSTIALVEISEALDSLLYPEKEGKIK